MCAPDAVETRAKAGFSLVELVMAIFVLAFGVLGLATTTLFVTRQLTLSEVTTARAGSSPDLCVKAEEAPRLRLGCLGDLLFLEE